MLTTADEFNQLLYKIQDQNAPSLAVLLPSTEHIYNVDLNSRTIEAPEFVGILKDHLAETIFFKCPRYFDNIDLTNTVCIIEYVNAVGTPFIWAVPYYDVDTLSVQDPSTGIDEPYILFPWTIEQGATEVAGTITFTMRFYRLDDSGTILQYNMNLLPAQTTVLNGLDPENSSLKYKEASDVLANYAETVLQYLKDASDIGVFWIDL